MLFPLKKRSVPCVLFQTLENRARFVLFMRDQGIDKKPGKGEFNACGMFIFLPIVENLESSETKEIREGESSTVLWLKGNHS